MEMQTPFSAIMHSWMLLAAFGSSYAPGIVQYGSTLHIHVYIGISPARLVVILISTCMIIEVHVYACACTCSCNVHVHVYIVSIRRGIYTTTAFIINT